MRFRILPLLLLCAAVLPWPALAKDEIAYVDPVTRMEFVAVPGGSFLMGDPTDELARPVREVKVKPFLIGRYEVTFAQYAIFCAATKRKLPGDEGWGMGNRPVINVSWHDAVDFTKWLSAKSGRTFRLPSEAEWEYAALGGVSTRFPWGNEFRQHLANCKECGSKWDNRSTAPVGSFKPNAYGLYDVVGNVYEWCLDLMHLNYVGAPTDGSPWVTGGNPLEERVYRGASYQQPKKEMTIAKRCWGEPTVRDNEHGFRVLLEP